MEMQEGNRHWVRASPGARFGRACVCVQGVQG
jgi:hypothetical protein